MYNVCYLRQQKNKASYENAAEKSSIRDVN